MYSGAKTVVRTVYGNSKSFEVKVGMHQGSALSPLLFVIVMEAISREFRVALPWVCSKGVGSNSLQCTSCQKWLHKNNNNNNNNDRLTAFDPGQPG